MYVIEQMTLQSIAADLKLNFKTVLKWKQEGTWEEKRLDYHSGKKAFHERLYNFVQKLMKSIEDDLDNGKTTDSKRFFTFTKLLPLMMKVKQYEDIIAKSRPAEKNNIITAEDMVEIEELLGLRRRPKEVKI